MSSDPWTGRTISHFRVVSRLGEGGMGVVYRATDRVLWRDVALKVLPPHVAEDGERRLALFHEARAAAAVGHTNIAAIHEVGMDGGALFIAMELVEGPSLRAALDAGLEPETALAIGVGLARGLARAHERGVLHRDLKPENVALDREGTPKILDFGLARVLGALVDDPAAPTAVGTLKGTLGYLSPEQARGEPLDERSDVYALGLVLFELLTGQRAVPLGTPIAMLLAATDGELPSLVERGVAPALADLVRRCCARRPEERFPHAGAVRDALVEATRSGPSSVASVATEDLVVGRANEVRAVLGAIEAGAPLVAVTGPPGTGTSTVARAALAATLADDPRPSVTVRLSESPDARRLVDALVRALDAPMRARADDEEALASALRTRPRWLVVVDDLARLEREVVELLRAALARVPGAQILLVAEDAPDVPAVPVASLDESAALVLLGARRTAVPPALLAALARLVDRRPLALRLLAPQTATIDGAADALAAAADELGPLPRPERLDRLLAWLLSALAPPARALAAALAVLEGPFDDDAAVGGPDARALLPVLSARGLLRREGDRWSMPRAVRRHLRAALGPGAVQAHAAWLTSLASRALDGWLDGRDRAPLDALEQALPEVVALADRSAHDLALADAAAVTLAALLRVLHLAGRLGIVLEIASRPALRERASAGPQCDLATALGAVMVHRSPEPARARAQEAAVLASRLGDRRRLALALGVLARAALGLAHPREAAAAADDAIRVARTTGVPALVERALADAGRAFSRADRLSDARLAVEEALASARARGAVRTLPELYVLAGYVLTLLGEKDAAAAYENDGVESARREGLDDVLGLAVQNRGASRIATARHDEARRDLLEAITCLERRDEPVLLATALGNLGVIDWEAGRLPGALSLFDRAIQILTQQGERHTRALFEAGRASVLAQHGDLPSARAGFATATELAQGSREQILRSAIALLHLHLDLAQARTTTDAAERTAILTRVRSAVADVYRPDGAGPALAQRSDVIRTVARTLVPDGRVPPLT